MEFTRQGRSFTQLPTTIVPNLMRKLDTLKYSLCRRCFFTVSSTHIITAQYVLSCLHRSCQPAGQFHKISYYYCKFSTIFLIPPPSSLALHHKWCKSFHFVRVIGTFDGLTANYTQWNEHGRIYKEFHVSDPFIPHDSVTIELGRILRLRYHEHI